MTSPPSPQPETKSRRKRGILWRAMVLSRAKRRWRWVLRAAIAIPLILIAAVIVLTHSPLTRMIILPRVAKATGLEVNADSIHIGLDGRVVMERAEFTIPGVPGEAGKFLKIAQVECTVDWWNAVGPAPVIGQVKMIDPVLILSESVEDGTLNVGRVPVPAGQKGGMQLPGIAATNLWVEVGEHGPAGYTRLKRIQMDGSLTPIPNTPGVYSVALYEAAQRGRGNAGFHVGGTVSEGKINLNLINFSLTDWPPSTLPESIRDIASGLALSGEVPKATFGYTLSEGITASMELRGVAMNLPVDASIEGPVLPDAPALRPMRMSGVDGVITFARDSVVAKVGGLIEDLPYEVSLRYNGVDADSPFRLEFLSKDFLVSRNPDLLVYAPPTVLYYLKTFLMPTGRLTTRVNVERGPPVKQPGSEQTQPGPITVTGSVDFREGTAAYESFPYEFSDMAGRFEFDNNELRILNVAGRSKTGAALHARGKIAPLDESSEVDIHVTVTDAQIDEAMEAAFGPDRGAVISALFSDRRHQELLDAGLIRTPEQAQAEGRELAAIQALQGDEAARAADRLTELLRREQIPVFEFRGRADVAVHVYAPRGVGTAYQTSVDVFLPHVGLIPEKFPYPLIAESVGVEVRDQKGRLTQGSFRGITGGKARVQAEFSVPGKSDTEPPAPPEIQIAVADIPLDPLLLRALPGGNDESGFKRIIRDLGISAALSGEVQVHQRDGRDELGFDAAIELKSGEARPRRFGESDGVAIAQLNASLEINERNMFLDIEGVPVRVTSIEDEDTVGPRTPLLLPGSIGEDPRIGGTLTVHVRGEFPESNDQGRSSYFVAATCPSLDVSSGLECFIGLFSTQGAARLAEARSRFHPAGFVDVRGEVDIAAETTGTVRLSSGRSLAADALDRRVSMPEFGGTVVVSVGKDTRVSFESVAGPLIVSRKDGTGGPAGTVLMEGEFVQGQSTGALQVALLDARFESELTRAILEQVQPREAGGESAPLSIIDRVRPTGTFDANITIRSGQESSSPLIAQGRIEPRTLTIQPGDQGVEFRRVQGAIEFDPSGGTLKGLELEAPEWSLRADGGWTGEPGSAGGIRFRSTLGVRGNKLADDLKAVLPVELRTLLDDLKLTINGPFELTQATLNVDRLGHGAGQQPAAQFAGRLVFAGAGLEAGVPITDMDGSLGIRFHAAAGDKPPVFELDLVADRFYVSGITLTKGSAKVRSGSTPGEVRITQAQGECHGGRFSVRADVTPEGDSRRLNAEFQLSGVRFSTLLREVTNSIRPMVGPPSPIELEEIDAMFDPAKRRDQFSRGLLDAELSLTALASDPESRRGRGTMRISGGRVLNLPVMTGLIEAMNLALPFNASLDFAWASVFVEGQLITFEDLSVQSSSIELSGSGTLSWPDRELDIRLQSRAARPIPILSAILQGIRHTLVEATITGKLGEPVVGIQSPGPSRMIDGILGGRPGTGQDSQSQFGTERARDRDARRGIRPQKPTSGVKRDPARNAGVPSQP